MRYSKFILKRDLTLRRLTSSFPLCVCVRVQEMWLLRPGPRLQLLQPQHWDPGAGRCPRALVPMKLGHLWAPGEGTRTAEYSCYALWNTHCVFVASGGWLFCLSITIIINIIINLLSKALAQQWVQMYSAGYQQGKALPAAFMVNTSTFPRLQSIPTASPKTSHTEQHQHNDIGCELCN